MKQHAAENSHLSRQGERWEDMESCAWVHAQKLVFRIECCQMLSGYSSPSLVIYRMALAGTLEGCSTVLPGGDNVPEHRPSQGVKEMIKMGIMKLAS